MERIETSQNQNEHLIDIIPDENSRLPSNPQDPIYHTSSTSSNRSNSRNNPSFITRQNDRNPLNSGLWISLELVTTVIQIISSVIVLSISKNEKPEAPLFLWVMGYASGCVATLPVLYWRYRKFYWDNNDQEISQSQQGLVIGDSPESTSYTAISVSQSPDEQISQSTDHLSFSNAQVRINLYERLNILMDHFKMTLDGFFAVWFVVGNVWVFGGHSSPSEAPNLYRLSLVFLTFSCIGYAMPFIMCATICCCMPCIVSILGFHEDRSHTIGASSDAINSLPTYKFKLNKNGNDNETVGGSYEGGSGGVLAPGTENERVVSGEDAVCCICLAQYAENNELRELPCSHIFHVECVDKWLEINASCPLCKCYICDNSSPSLLARDSSHS